MLPDEVQELDVLSIPTLILIHGQGDENYARIFLRDTFLMRPQALIINNNRVRLRRCGSYDFGVNLMLFSILQVVQEGKFHGTLLLSMDTFLNLIFC